MGTDTPESNSSGNFTPGGGGTAAGQEDRVDVLTGYWLVILSVLMATLVILIVAGNALVIVAFIVDKTLRTQSNYFFLNLAMSDFLVGKSPRLLLRNSTYRASRPFVSNPSPFISLTCPPTPMMTREPLVFIAGFIICILSWSFLDLIQHTCDI